MALNQLAQFGPLDAITYVQQQGEMGRARGQQNQLAQLASQSYSATPEQQNSLLSQMAAINPKAAQAQQTQFQGQEDRQRKSLVNASKIFLNTPEEYRAGVYMKTIAPGLRQMGINVPDYTPEAAQQINETAMALIQAGGGDTASGVQSTYVDDQGRRVAILRDGSTRVLGANAANNQIIDTGNGYFGVNKGTLSATPVTTGGAPAGAASAGIYRTSTGEMLDVSQVQDPQLRQQILANPAQFGLAPDGGNVAMQVSPSGMGQQLNKAPAQITPYQEAQLVGQYRDDARADRSLQLQESAAQQRLADQQTTAQEKRLASSRAAQGVIDSTDDALSTIQRLRNHPGFRELGTVRGDAATSVPLIRTDAKGANAILETVKSQALINTLSALKQASATGASGFGSLTEKEGAALQASMANLSTAQSHQDLNSALGQIETILQRTRNRTLDSIQARGGSLAPAPQQPTTGAPQPGHTEGGYRFRGGNPADPNSWEKL